MNLVARAVTAASYITGKSRGGQVSQIEPNIFAGTVWLCDELKQAIGKSGELMIAVDSARSVNDYAGMAKASADLGIAVSQISRMTTSLVQVLRWHADHKARSNQP